MVLGKLDIHVQDNEIASFNYIIHKSQLKID